MARFCSSSFFTTSRNSRRLEVRSRKRNVKVVGFRLSARRLKIERVDISKNCFECRRESYGFVLFGVFSFSDIAFYTDAKPNFATHSDLSVEIKDCETHTKPRLEICFINLEKLHQLSTKSLLEKAELNKYLPQSLTLKKSIYQSGLSRLHHFPA